MRAPAALVLLVAGIVAWVGPSLAVQPLYLEGITRGPYRGRVVDAETQQPLAGAAVVAMWDRVRRLPLHSRNEFYAAREVLTDADGRFVLDARDIEENAPEETYLPHFVIYYPGYGFFPQHQVTPRGPTGGIFEGAGVTVELPRLKTREERRDTVSLSRMGVDRVPRKQIAGLVRLVNLEAARVGLKPYPEKD